MVSAAMFFTASTTGVINNNNIGIENAKFYALNNKSLQDYGELNHLIINNNLMMIRYSHLTITFFILSLILGLISIFIVLKKTSIK